MISLLNVASESEEYFTHLMFGDGAWLSLLLIIAIMFFVVYKIKFSSAVFIPFSVFLIITYWDNVASTSIFMWNTVLLVFSMVVMLALEAKR